MKASPIFQKTLDGVPTFTASPIFMDVDLNKTSFPLIGPVYHLTIDDDKPLSSGFEHQMILDGFKDLSAGPEFQFVLDGIPLIVAGPVAILELEEGPLTNISVIGKDVSTGQEKSVTLSDILTDEDGILLSGLIPDTAPISVTGSRSSGAALTSLLTALEDLGIVVDSTVA